MLQAERCNPSALDSLIAGSLSGCAGVLICHPFDVIRTRIQISKVQKGAVDCFRDIVKESGLKGLYTGIIGPFFAQAVYKAVIFTTNTMVSKYLFTGQKSNQSVFLSGAIAGSLNAFIVSPVELLRTRQIISVNASYSKILLSLLSESGVKGLFRGLAPAIIRDGPGVGAYFLTFDICKRHLSPKFLTSSDLSPSDNASTVQPSSYSLLTVKLLSGSCAGIAFWTIALPVDTVKTIIESSNTNNGLMNQFRSVYSTIVQAGGITTLFRAWPVAIGRGIPSAAVTLTTFDFVSEWLASRNKITNRTLFYL